MLARLGGLGFELRRERAAQARPFRSTFSVMDILSGYKSLILDVPSEKSVPTALGHAQRLGPRSVRHSCYASQRQPACP
jgi:hypothetical protein